MVDQSIQFVARQDHQVDWESAEKHIFARPYQVVVEMLPVPESSGEILIAGTEGDKGRLAPDLGVVISAGDGVPLLPGDLVAVNHEHGKHMFPFFAGPHWDGDDLKFHYVAKNEVRFYGAVALTGGKAKYVPYWRSILAIVNYDTDHVLKPVGKQVLVDRGDLVEKTEGGVYLPDSHTRRPGIGTILAKGSQVDPTVNTGTRWVYESNLMKPVRGLFGVGPEGQKIPKNYGIIEEVGLLAEVDL